MTPKQIQISVSHCEQEMTEITHPEGMFSRVIQVEWTRLFVCLKCGHVVTSSGVNLDAESLETLKDCHEELEGLDLDTL